MVIFFHFIKSRWYIPYQIWPLWNPIRPQNVSHTHYLQTVNEVTRRGHISAQGVYCSGTWASWGLISSATRLFVQLRVQGNHKTRAKIPDFWSIARGSHQRGVSIYSKLVQERRNSSVNALELRLSCTNSSSCRHHMLSWISRFSEDSFMQLGNSNSFESDGLIFVFETHHYIDGLVQERRNSLANAPELCLFCTNPSI